MYCSFHHLFSECGLSIYSAFTNIVAIVQLWARIIWRFKFRLAVFVEIWCETPVLYVKRTLNINCICALFQYLFTRFPVLYRPTNCSTATANTAFHGNPSRFTDLVNEPGHAEGVQLLVEELHAKLSSQQRHVLNYSQPVKYCIKVPVTVTNSLNSNSLNSY